MSGYRRLRQICLATRQLEPVAGDISRILGLDICHRDPHLAVYGLENAIFVLGTCFIEIVAPTRPDTAAERFIERSGGRGGYMVIFDCHDPQQWRLHAESMGVAVAHTIREAGYHSVQLHPRDCRAAMIEFGHTEGGDELTGTYAPAGPDWRAFVTARQARSLTAIELESRHSHDLARHWSRLLDVPMTEDGPAARLVLADQTLRFVAGEDERERFSAVHVAVADVAAARTAAQACGYAVAANTLRLAGVDFRLSATP